MSEKLPQRERKLLVLDDKARVKVEESYGDPLYSYEQRHSVMANFIGPLMRLGPSIMISDIKTHTLTAVISGTRKDLDNVLKHFQECPDEGWMENLLNYDDELGATQTSEPYASISQSETTVDKPELSEG
ncbi:hypothetical protein KKF55_04910 [Patescibacteria group bacterium]|nr:hypothetical protein [Patescibacteria group bacterium]